ncbi:SgcJ/EcaC family oxidoreductase [Cellulomonas sp. JZ18]|uniref:SgcJ/EcaC family oxidoreductase n=1 Tax=Cellulomonas sp. JZ18 TaxID=2654191 RepID=UPI0012D40126|nr:SgcJ/EcaC family oxidoreductase [Cellulomonas sp. JZ18]QGQ18057.1 SgcJ/EcaC family oxidoreductase [Cellulomonas sp. JZ18]
MPARPLIVAAVAALVAATGTGVAVAAEPAPGTDLARPGHHGTPTKAEIRRLFTTWNAALATGDPERVDDLYADDAVLLPTLAPGVHDTSAERIGYFEHFLANDPSGSVDEGVVRVLGKDVATYSGLYTFTFAATGDVVHARFTFVYERDHGGWEIVEHHSSLVPGE